MAHNKDDKPGGEHASINDSGELLRSLFREDLDAITAEKRKENAAKTGDKRSAPKTAKYPAQGKDAGGKKVRPETGTEKRKIVKNYPVSEVQVDEPGKVASTTDSLLKKAVGEESAPQIREDTPEEVRPEESLKTKPLKVALLSVLLVATAAFLLSSFGVVDFGQLLGLSEPARKAGRKTGVAKKPPAKKSTRVAAESTHKTTNNKASDKAHLSGERGRVIHKTTKPVPSTKKPIIVQEHSKPYASTQKEVVPGRPAESATVTQEPPVTKTPAEPVDPAQEPLVAKNPPEPTAPKAQPVVTKAVSRSAERTPEKAALATENGFPVEKDLSYPYSIYLGSYKTRERAERAISEYRNRGLSPYRVKVDLGDKGVWYRVFSGYFQKREQANEFIKKKQIAESKSRNTRYANLIGLFAFQKELDEEKLRLSKLGYCPYVIPSRKGESLLYVGAFYQKARAERQQAELASKGIHSQIVER